MTELNGKISSESKHMLNPFVHKLALNNPIDILRTILFTVLILPLRIFGIFVCLIIAWIFACIGLYGLTMQDISAKPLIGWRRKCRDLAAVAMRCLFWCGSFLNIKIKGRQATVNEAPILVVAPHSSFCDTIAVIMLGAPAVVAKAETASLPIFGKLINFAQPIYVWRDDPNSRQNTIKGIIERAKSKDDWTQILIFPEGTCTNRSCLITFKQGAFYPGVPVQPVCIRYPNKLDSITWTWEGPGVLKLLWLTLTQLQNFCEIEFLPVYIPNDEEKMDPKLFAKNVRKVMANAHAIPVSDYTYDDCKIMIKAKDRNMPYAADIVDIEKLRQKIGLSQTNIEEQLVTSNLVNDTNYNINLSEFLLRLKLSTEDNNATQQLFAIFSKDNTGFIDFRDYLLYALFLITKKKPLNELIYLLSKMHHNGKFPDRITKESLYHILRYTLTVTLNETNLIFEQIDKTKQGYITYDELKNYLRLKPEYSYVFKCSR